MFVIIISSLLAMPHNIKLVAIDLRTAFLVNTLINMIQRVINKYKTFVATTATLSNTEFELMYTQSIVFGESLKLITT